MPEEAGESVLANLATSLQAKESRADEPAQAPETDWKAESRKWEQRAKDNKAKLDEAAPKLSEYDRLVEASKSDLERKTEELTRWQTEAEKWRAASVASRIETLASQDFADPSDAAAALPDPTKYLGVDGQIDDSAIRTDLAAVLEKKPHWRRPDAPVVPRVPAPNRAQGAGVGPSAPNPAAEFAAILQAQTRS